MIVESLAVRPGPQADFLTRKAGTIRTCWPVHGQYPAGLPWTQIVPKKRAAGYEIKRLKVVGVRRARRQAECFEPRVCLAEADRGNGIAE